ncbi:hypothetical protein EVAR_43321_1 [Eumeta japonica]|uniref:Uncharacterized protein n=1 Tax=Eumeta variegata TaxID=151549 RepID=A0A4C1WNI0_EUMVA|nr:hypothetical protein EVAR_43321_1 [Eumeta japonica]
MQPLSIGEVAENNNTYIIAFAASLLAPRVGITLRDYFFRPECRADISHVIEVRTNRRIPFEVHRHDASLAVFGFYHNSCDVFVDKGLILLDVHATAQDYYGGFDGSPLRSRFWTTRYLRVKEQLSCSKFASLQVGLNETQGYVVSALFRERSSGHLL